MAGMIGVPAERNLSLENSLALKFRAPLNANGKVAKS